MPSAGKDEVLILGAGLAGLSAATQLSTGYRLIEKSERVGGLCKTDVRQGFCFDATGHWLHLRDPSIQTLAQEVLPDGWITVDRRAAIWSHRVFTPYPYQVNTAGLPPEVIAENLLGFIEAHYGEMGRALRERKPRSFGEFIQCHLGQGFARNFMVPYNRKLWTVHPDDLSAEWTGRFVPCPTLEQVVRGALGLEAEGAGYNAQFLYPRQGGIESFAAALGRRLVRPAECGVRVLSLDVKRKTALLTTGEEIRWRAVIGTIPLPELVALCGEVPPLVREAVSRLRATTVTYVNLAARDRGAPPFHWLYLPEERDAPYRVGSASAVVSSVAPAGHRSFYVEFSARDPLPPLLVERQAVETLLDLGLLRLKEDLLFAETRIIPQAYVIHDFDYGPARKTVLDYLATRDILTAGRYGSWEYSSMEDALLGGRDSARKVA